MTRSDPTSETPRDAYEPPVVEELEAGQGPIGTAPGVIGRTGVPGPTPGAAPRDF